MILYHYIINKCITKYILIRQGAVHLWRTLLPLAAPAGAARQFGRPGRAAGRPLADVSRPGVPARSRGAPEGVGVSFAVKAFAAFMGRLPSMLRIHLSRWPPPPRPLVGAAGARYSANS